MVSKKLLANRFLVIPFLLIFFVNFPLSVEAETNSDEVQQTGNFELYKTTQDVTVGNISIKKSTYIYGEEKEDGVRIQYGEIYKPIPVELVEKVETGEEVPGYFNLEVAEKELFKKESSFYSSIGAENPSVSTLEDIEYPLYQDEEGNDVIYIGNIAFFYEEKEDIVMTEDDSSKTTGGETETTTTEEQLTSEDPEEPKQDSEEPAVSGEEGTEEPTIDSNEELNTEVSESEGEKEVQSETEQTVLVQATANSTDPWDGVISDYFKVTTTTTVYDNRGSGSLRPMGQLKQGQVYPRVSDYGNWHRIEFGGIYGYVRKSDTVPDDGGSLQNENGNYTNQSRTFETLKDVTVYDNTSGSLVPFGQISKGEQYALAGDYGKWWRVLFSDRIGYVRKEEVKAETKPTDNYFRVYHADIPVYDNRSGSLKKVGELEKGQSYSIVRDYGNWWRIQFGDFYGYVRKSDTGYATESEIPNMNKNHTNTAHKLETKQQVEVYDNTSGSLVPFGKIDKGQLFPIAADYGNWWRILYLDRVGYVRKNEANVQYADFADYFKAEEDLPVYDNRSSDSLKKVGEVEKDQVYTRVSDYGNWHRIQFGDFYGYVEKFATSPATGEAVKNKNDGYSNQNRTFETLEDVTVYDNASGSLKPFGKIEKGERFPIATDYGNWWRVLYSDQVGYVSKDRVKAAFKSGDAYFRVFKDNLAVYDNSGSSLKKVGELKKGQAYPILRDYGNWWRIQFGEIYGYVRKADTGYATESEVPNLNKKYSNSDSDLVTNDKVTVYDNTSGSLVAFGSLEAETVFPIATDYGDWWRVVFADRVGYVNKSDVGIYGVSKTNYDLTLTEAVKLQMKVNPQTDSNYGYVSKSYIDSNDEVTASVLNVRGGPGTKYKEIGQLTNGTKVSILGEYDGWYQIKFNGNAQWVTASEEDVRYYLNPNNFLENDRQKFQFLDLGRASNATTAELDGYLSGKGILSGKGSSFIDASNIHGISDVYLVSHALLETGNGTADLSTGVEVGKDNSGALVLVNNDNRNSLKDIKTTYNMYGIGAVDGNAYEGGAFRAYREGWFSPEKAIIGGAKFIGNSFIKAGQNTLYKMRWNPAAMDSYGYASHQYATDIGWAYKQVGTMYNLYQDIGLTTLFLDVPLYK